MMMLLFIKQHLSNIETQFMRKLSNTGAELKKSVAYKNKRVMFNFYGTGVPQETFLYIQYVLTNFDRNWYHYVFCNVVNSLDQFQKVNQE